MLPRIGEEEEMQNNNQLAIIALVAALALVGVVVVTVAFTIPLQQQAEAARPVGAGCPGTVPGANASKTRCFNG
jgi:hypothetical protein